MQKPVSNRLDNLPFASTFIGMDEAGYGPNLGPLVIAASTWTLPGDPARFDFYDVLADVISREGTSGGTLLHGADSKLVHSAAHGLAPLETSALALLRTLGVDISSYQALLDALSCGEPKAGLNLPWRDGCELKLPLAANNHRIADLSTRLGVALRREQVEFRAIRVAALEPDQFNAGLAQSTNKAHLLTRTALNLLATQWQPGASGPTLVVGDKHGGRNRYVDSLAEILDGEMILTIEESTAISRYRVGRAELRFQTKGEQHFPVAVSSIIAKYLRELSLELFNRYWQEQVSGLKPTKGYPEDARRFRDDILPHVHKLGLQESDWWRLK